MLCIQTPRLPDVNLNLSHMSDSRAAAFKVPSDRKVRELGVGNIPAGVRNMLCTRPGHSPDKCLEIDIALGYTG